MSTSATAHREGLSRAVDDAYWSWILSGSDTRLLERAPESLSADEVLDYLATLQRQRAAIDALEARALVVAAGTHRRVRGVIVYDDLTDDECSLELVDEVREEIAALLVRSPLAVDRQIECARMLVGWLRPTLAALEDGRIGGAQAHAVAEAALRLATTWPVVLHSPDLDSPEDGVARIEFARACDRLQAYLLPRLPGLTPGQARSAARRIVARIDREGEERRRRQAARHIDVQVFPDGDGLAVLHARMPMEAAARVQAVIQARADELHAARPSDSTVSPALGECRVQALVEALCGREAAATSAGDRQVCGVEIQVVVPLDALLGITDAPASIRLGGGAPESISTAAVRGLLADDTVPVTLRRLVSEPVTGHLLDRGRTAYRVTRALREYLVARDGTCRFPGCARSARAPGSQADHAVPWEAGGTTDRANLGLLCARHHQLKTHGGWRITESRASGAACWRSPSGREYRVEPPPVW